MEGTWTNGSVNGTILTVQPGVGYVTYDYNCYNSKVATFKLSFDSVADNGGGSGSTGYSVAVGETVNGTVTVSPKSASNGSTVTITVTPDTGYTLKTLTVTDASGKEVKLTGKNGKCTFTMPAGKVEIKATFMEDNTMLNFFVDVPADAYYYASAVLWAAENGITGGTSAATFSPSNDCTRAQIVTFLFCCLG